ncbi:MAG: hypothetical protein A3J38_03630 [Gammaproteobacteria bacterium RIFCSPHIGHO2_12_FULL_45_9]|nr:MAG: hypothetical protein A3J38_03630 [Gammaproteobacteria bacterium RIFCSPHIGHO2_12_FULL_45_9]
MKKNKQKKKHKLLLSISAAASLLSLNASFADNTVSTSEQKAPQQVSAEKSSSHGGKCAIGKCGNEKRFAKVNLLNDPQDHLVRARDGKCGTEPGVTTPVTTPGGTTTEVTTEKADPKSARSGKCSSGVCGA